LADSLDISGLDRTELRACIAQPWIVTEDMPATFSESQLKMRYAFNRLRRVLVGKISLHLHVDGTIGVEDIPVSIQLNEPTFGDPNEVMTTERMVWEIKQKYSEFSQYSAELLDIAANHVFNPSALQNALRMESTELMKNTLTYTNILGELPVLLMVCQKRNNRFRPW